MAVLGHRHGIGSIDEYYFYPTENYGITYLSFNLRDFIQQKHIHVLI